MSTNERLLKLATADAVTLARVDAVLNHTDNTSQAKDPDVRLLTYTETAKMMRLSRPTVYRLARAGKLRVVPLNGINRILYSSVIDYINGKGE